MKQIKVKDSLDIQNDLSTYAAQAKSLLCVLISNDHFMSMDNKEVSNVLWLAENRLGDIIQSLDALHEKLSKEN